MEEEIVVTDPISYSAPSQSSENLSAVMKSDFQQLRQLCKVIMDDFSIHANQPFELLTTQIVSRTKGISKVVLFEHLQKLLRHCNQMCRKDDNTPSYDSNSNNVAFDETFRACRLREHKAKILA